MIDIKLIRDDPGAMKQRLLKKGADCSAEIDRILALDERRREIIATSESDKAEQNKVSKRIPEIKKSGGDTSGVFAQMNALKEKIREAEAELREVEGEYRDLMLVLPNPPDDDLAPGGKENNEPLRYHGEPHTFGFEPQNHLDLCTKLGLIDYPRGAKLAGCGFWVYRGLGARL
jgi:seryl-tRNA synthetase